MTEYSIKDIPANSYFSEPVYLDKHFILLAPEMLFTEELRKTLKEWQFLKILSKGEPGPDYTPVGYETGDGTIISSVGLTERNHIKHAEEIYQNFYQYTETLFARFAVKGVIDLKSLSEKIKEICDCIKENNHYLFRILKSFSVKTSMGFLSTHAVKSAIISIIIGTHLKLPHHRLIELGIAAVLHEVGMIKIPSQLYMTKRPLSPEDQKTIRHHPVLSYNILKSCDVPIAISIAALEHHERENGEGYPRKLTGDKITLYAKIIAVACSYEAMTSDRPYRDASDAYASMIDLLKNVGKQYDDTIVRALVFSLSIYPIGLYVFLSNGQKAQVVDINPENPKYPIVQIFGKLTPDGKNMTLETSAEGLSIVRLLTREEIDSQSP